MAAWLAYLKSCLLLPKDPEQDPSPEELALRLQLRLQRLDAMREAGARLMGRDRLAVTSLRAARRRAAAGPQVRLAGAAVRPCSRLWRGQGAHPAGDARRPTARS
jgi:chromatin segregation and condensation protein Rec8/ScpA/Scc1 (kleisin family)